MAQGKWHFLFCTALDMCSSCEFYLSFQCSLSHSKIIGEGRGVRVSIEQHHTGMGLDDRLATLAFGKIKPISTFGSFGLIVVLVHVSLMLFLSWAERRTLQEFLIHLT
jgi:hypothetical protein